jgi:hypothetical protein
MVGEMRAAESFLGLDLLRTLNEQETLMGFNPKDALDSARDIATHAVKKASDIVDGAGEIIAGDVAGGTGRIIEDSVDIATHAVDKAKEIVTGKDSDAEQ